MASSLARWARRIVPPLLALLVIGGGLWWWRPWAASAAAPVTYKTAAVDRGAIQARITATGTVTPRVTVAIGSQVSGRLLEVLVDFNDKVTKGQVLARIDPSSLEAQLEQAQASRAAAKANLARSQASLREAERAHGRATQLAEQKLIAPADVDVKLAAVETGRADVTAQRAQVAQVDSSIKQLRISIDNATIRSSIDGIVIDRDAEVGQAVAAGLSVTTLFTIAEDLAAMQVDTSVSEGDVGRLADGQRTTFTVDAYAGKTFEGVVRQIRNQPTTVSGVVTYNAVIDVSNAGGELRPGMTASVTFIVAELPDALRLPNAALRFSPTLSQLQAVGAMPKGGAMPSRGGSGGPPGGLPGGPTGGAPTGGASSGKMVWKRTETGMAPVRVTLGLSDGTTTAITGGDLTAGDELVTELVGVAKGTNMPKMGAF